MNREHKYNDPANVPEDVAEAFRNFNEDQKARYATLKDLGALTAQTPVGQVQFIHISKVQANDYNPNSVAHREMKLLHTSISEDGYCVEKTTPVLKADLTWVPAHELETGDEIIAIDEMSTSRVEGGRKQRRFRTTQVIANFVEPSELVEVNTSKGSIKTTPDHPLLAERNYGKGFYPLEWIEARDLKPGDQVVKVVEPWEFDESRDAGWLAGFLDGEGTVSQNQREGHAPHVRLAGYQAPGPTAEKMIEEMSSRALTKVYEVDRTNHPSWDNMVMARVDRTLEIMRLLGSVRPERLIEQAGRFWEGSGVTSSTGGNRAEVLSVEPVGEGEIARLSTVSKTYIAGGFASHNTQPTVAIYDEEIEKYVIVDGFHRYTTMRLYEDIAAMTYGHLPIVVIDKPIEDRIASTVRHNRARGKHSMDGMSNLVFQMLTAGEDDVTICNKLGLEPSELARLKHITGYSKLYADHEFSKVTLTRTQMRAKAKHKRENPDEVVPQF